jgi:hypothetical protein
VKAHGRSIGCVTPRNKHADVGEDSRMYPEHAIRVSTY